MCYNDAVPEIEIGGDGFRLTLGVAGYEREPADDSYKNDNWLRGTVTLEIAHPPTATFTARCDVAWETTDLLRFEEVLRTLLDDLTGVAELSTVEDQIELTIRLEQGSGTVEGRVEAHTIAALEFEGTTDQSFLQETLGALRRVNDAYPYRK